MLACVIGFCPARPARTQETPVQTIEEEITAFAYAPDGRIVYSVRRLLKTKQYDLQRDDIWLQGSDGKRRRLVQGGKLTLGNAPFSYSVDSFCWSPDGHMILAQLDTLVVVDDSGNTQEAKMAFLVDDTGKPIRIADSRSVLFEAINAAWLADNATVVYLREALKPHLLFGLMSLRFASGRAGALFVGRTFVDAEWIPKTSTAIAVERDRNLTGPPRLQQLDLVKETDAELATLDTFAGGLTVSPSGTLAAYYLDHEVLEIRDLALPGRSARLRVGFGAFRWSPDGKRILLKRTPEKKSGDLVWVDVPSLTDDSAHIGDTRAVAEPQFVPILHGLTFRDFQISPDGRVLAVIRPGNRNLLVYPLPSR